MLNFPQGVGTICLRFWEIWPPTKNAHFDIRFVCYYCVFKPLPSSMFKATCDRQNDQTDHRIIPWFSSKSHFDMVFAGPIRVFHVKLAFSIVCIIHVFPCMQHMFIYVYIYTYILIPMCFYVLHPFWCVYELGEVFPAAAGIFFVKKDAPRWIWIGFKWNYKIYIDFCVFMDLHRFGRYLYGFTCIWIYSHVFTWIYMYLHRLGRDVNDSGAWVPDILWHPLAVRGAL